MTTPDYSTTKPWLTEPIEDSFLHADLHCVLARRDQTSHWCGYVGVPKGHMLYGLGYSDALPPEAAFAWRRKLNEEVETDRLSIFGLFTAGEKLEDGTIDLLLSAHGGITWADNHPGGPDGEAAVMFDGNDVPYWYFGFDCAHAGDFSPIYDTEALRSTLGGVYRDYSYAKAETEHLAGQLAALRLSPIEHMRLFVGRHAVAVTAASCTAVAGALGALGGLFIGGAI